jgi:hypothetical protein
MSGSCAYGFDPSTGGNSACGTCQPALCGGGCGVDERCIVDVDGGAACKPARASGQACSAPTDCETLYCDPDASTCGAPALLGQPCGDGTSGPPCAGANAYCDQTQHCSEFQLAGYGESCGLVDGGTYVCRGFGTCDTTSNTCIPPAGDGNVCDENQQLGCLWPARCIGNFCRYPSLAYCSGAPTGP